MNFQEQLEDEYSRIQRLKANIHLQAIKDYLQVERKKWRPKTKEIEGPVWRGSKGDGPEFHTLYFDEYTLEWTDKDIAFKGHVFKQLSEIIRKQNQLERWNSI